MTAPADTNPLREAVATELIAHGEFSSSGNSYPNALLAADEVIKIVRAALASEPVAGTDHRELAQWLRDQGDNPLLEEAASLIESMSPAPAGRDLRDIGILLSALRNLEDAVGEDYDDEGGTIAQIEADYLAGIVRANEGTALPPQGDRATVSTPEPVAYRWRTLPRYREAGDDGDWSWITTAPDFINPHHHEVEPLYATPPAPGAADRAEWQPIETAPRDGTDITVWHKVWKCPVSARYLADRKSDCKWVETTLTTQWPDDCFTHWQPLPDRPALPRADRGIGS